MTRSPVTRVSPVTLEEVGCGRLLPLDGELIPVESNGLPPDPVGRRPAPRMGHAIPRAENMPRIVVHFLCRWRTRSVALASPRLELLVQPPSVAEPAGQQIGRASCRERV